MNTYRSDCPQTVKLNSRKIWIGSSSPTGNGSAGPERILAMTSIRLRTLPFDYRGRARFHWTGRRSSIHPISYPRSRTPPVPVTAPMEAWLKPARKEAGQDKRRTRRPASGQLERIRRPVTDRTGKAPSEKSLEIAETICVKVVYCGDDIDSRQPASIGRRIHPVIVPVAVLRRHRVSGRDHRDVVPVKRLMPRRDQ